jgi:hypothetical protein
VRAVGVSNYGPRQLEKVHRYLTEQKGVPLASAQVIPGLQYAARFVGGPVVLLQDLYGRHATSCGAPEAGRELLTTLLLLSLRCSSRCSARGRSSATRRRPAAHWASSS